MQTILVTGANRGLGLEFVRQYSEQGHRILACCRSPNTATDLQALSANNKNIETYRLDVTNGQQIHALAQQLADQSIDIVINNAGVIGVKDRMFGDLTADEWLSVLAVNTVAPALITQAFVDHVARSASKLICVITSFLGSIAETHDDYYCYYRSSKAALNMTMRALSSQLLARQIKVAILHPGWVKTDMSGPNAPMEPVDSIRGMRQVLDQFTLEQSGRFWNHQGKELLW